MVGLLMTFEHQDFKLYLPFIASKSDSYWPIYVNLKTVSIMIEISVKIKFSDLPIHFL